MDDDLLADDGQFKDDGLDELDIDEEAALLGLSDEENGGATPLQDDKDFEYVDEDGNPVDIGESNAELYEVAGGPSNKHSTLIEDDVLELDLESEIDSFTQENSDIRRETPPKQFPERQFKDNLISLTSRSDHRRESLYSRTPERVTDDDFLASSHSRSPIEFDEESEDESIGDDHRERFKSERSNIITLTHANKRTDIPDTLESVISVEETAKVQAFLENEQKRKMRFKGRGHSRMKNPARSARPNQPYQNSAQHQPQFSSHNSVQQQQPPQMQQQYQPLPAEPQPRKILINPHFRGARLPLPVTVETVPVEQNPPVSLPPPSYEAPPPTNYGQNVYQEGPHPINVAPLPIYSTPPPTMAPNPGYIPQQHMQQALPSIWQPPPDMHAPGPYSTPQPQIHYGDHVPQVHQYHPNYQQNNFQSPTYSPPQLPPPPPQTINYNQPPPPMHLHPTSYAPEVSQMHGNASHMQFPVSQNRQQQNNRQKPYQEQRNAPHTPVVHNQRKNIPQNQRFNRQPEKRPSNVNIKHVPMKQQRLEPRKNAHVNKSNITEIPLVDTLPTPPKQVIKAPVIAEDEDEKTKELRRKIEEQKLLREQILKRKEERRRQMAAQRLMELKKRQSVQNNNVISVPRKEQSIAAQPAVQPKLSVKQRIGIPVSADPQQGKKKVVVVRKKDNQAVNNLSLAQQKKAGGFVQRVGVPAQTKQQQNAFLQQSAVNPALNQQIRPKPAAPSVSKPLLNQTNSTATTQKTFIKTNTNTKNAPLQKQKNNILQRLGNRGNTQKQPPAFNQNRGPPQPRARLPPTQRFNGPQLFQEPPFMEHRMRFPPMNDRHPPFTDLHPPFSPNQRPPLLPFHPHGEPPPFDQFMFEPNHPLFHMPEARFQDFNSRGMERFSNRFPPPHFQNDMQPMRPQFEPNGPMYHHRPPFQRQRPNGNWQKKSGGNSNPSNKPSLPSQKKTEDKTLVAPEAASKGSKSGTMEAQQNCTDSANATSHSVSVENLSSSTSEVQLKKLCATVGVVENISLIKDERKAVIKFKQPAQAANFHKKYQRYMLDLAMIQVSLLPA